MFRAIKRLFIWFGLMAEQATETDAINQAVVERGIRDSKAKADKAHYANGQLAGQIALLRDQSKRQDRQREELPALLKAATAANDASNGAASGEGQMRATLHLAKQMGSGISRQQESRKARGAMLFQEYKKKMGMVQPEVAATAQPAAAQPERQKIAEQ